jgi:hypothetical protein
MNCRELADKRGMSTKATILATEDLTELQWAHRHLEHPSLAARLSGAVGIPIEQGLRLLPKQWYQRLQAAAELSVRRLVDLAIASMGPLPSLAAHDSLHKFLALSSGAVGGFFGPLALLAELPVVTTLMLRSIADIAHSQGEDLSTVEARIACVEVFALGGRSTEDNSAETGYFGLRMTLAFHFTDFLDYTGNRLGVTVPAGINFVRAIAARFGTVISDKMAAQLIPIVGAVSGSLLNLVFMQHFQDVARGHFIVRRLERKYGSAVIRLEYERLTRKEAEAEREYNPLEGW